MQISALVLEIFKSEKWIKYANEMTDDVMYSTQYFIKYINRAILTNLQCRTLKLGRLIVPQETHLWLYTGYCTVVRRYEFYVRVAGTISHE